VLKAVTESVFLKTISPSNDRLTVRVSSFSYKKGIPHDPSGNGGGFVFDCRAIHNPGRYLEYKHLTGKDPQVQEFLEEKSTIASFMESVISLVSQSVEVYSSRGFSHLCVSFGCTGGQHRSVYAAEKLAEYLRNNYPVTVVLQHVEQDKI
jgi:RNase adaptor protein for sRNA GlmZ degradation